MDREEIECLLEAIENIVKNQRGLSVRLGASEQAIQTLLDRSAHSGYKVMDVEQNTDEPTLGSSDDDDSSNSNGNIVVQPLSWARLDRIKRDVSEKASTWQSLRTQYPPGQSVFAPLNFAANSWAALVRTGLSDLDAKIAVDEAYSQAATMAAYGAEVLRVALSSSQLDRKHVRQAGDILATLCTTLIDTRDQHRSVVTKAAVDIVNASGYASCESEAAEPVPAIPHRHTRQRARLQSLRGRRRDNRYVASKRSHPYRRKSLRSESSRQPPQQPQQLHSCESSSELSTLDMPLLDGILANTNLSTRAPSTIGVMDSLAETVLITVPDSDTLVADSTDETYGASEVDADPASAATRTTKQRLAVGLRRQSVIRDALLRQGQSESDITAYFDQFGKGTNGNYNSSWSKWAHWCIARGLDLLLRSAVDLDTCISEGHFSTRWAKQVKKQVEFVWSIVEGLPPPAFYNHHR